MSFLSIGDPQFWQIPKQCRPWAVSSHAQSLHLVHLGADPADLPKPQVRPARGHWREVRHAGAEIPRALRRGPTGERVGGMANLRAKTKILEL